MQQPLVAVDTVGSEGQHQHHAVRQLGCAKHAMRSWLQHCEAYPNWATYGHTQASTSQSSLWEPATVDRLTCGRQYGSAS